MKPSTAAGYRPEQLERVRSVCLYLATKLADLRDLWVVLGGLAPSLLVDQQGLGALERHVGTLDVDLGLQLAVLHEEGREGGIVEIADTIRRFSQDSAVVEGLSVLNREFRRVDAAGPTRSGVFLGLDSDEHRAQVVGLVDALLRTVGP